MQARHVWESVQMWVILIKYQLINIDSSWIANEKIWWHWICSVIKEVYPGGDGFQFVSFLANSSGMMQSAKEQLLT